MAEGTNGEQGSKPGRTWASFRVSGRSGMVFLPSPLKSRNSPLILGILRYQSAVLNFCFHRFAFIKDPEGRAELILTAF